MERNRLGGEVALQADDVRIEVAAVGQPFFLAVDAQVDDHALMAVLLQARRDADGTERLDEGEHLQPQDPADGRFDEGDFHGLRDGTV